MEQKSWKGVPCDKAQLWQKVFSKIIAGIRVPGTCPVCSQAALRHYYYIGRPMPQEFEGVRFQSRGGLWEWCANCRTYEHSQALVPEVWQEVLPNLDHSKLTAIPDVIDEMATAAGL